MNVLVRFNKKDELNANFKIENFKHYSSYDPVTRAVKHCIISLKDQEVKIGNEIFPFMEHEAIQTSASQKFRERDVDIQSSVGRLRTTRVFKDFASRIMVAAFTRL